MNKEQKSPEEIADIAQRIGVIIEMMMSWSQAFEDDELAEFEQYVNKQESAGFIFDPTEYRFLLWRDGFVRVKQRIKVLRQIKTLAESEAKYAKETS